MLVSHISRCQIAFAPQVLSGSWFWLQDALVLINKSVSWKQNKMSSFNYWKVSWTWVIAEELRKGAKRSQTNQRSCLSLSRAQRHFTVRILLQYRSYLLFAVSQYRLFWVIKHACDILHTEMLCGAGIETLLL